MPTNAPRRGILAACAIVTHVFALGKDWISKSIWPHCVPEDRCL